MIMLLKSLGDQVANLEAQIVAKCEDQQSSIKPGEIQSLEAELEMLQVDLQIVQSRFKAFENKRKQQ